MRTRRICDQNIDEVLLDFLAAGLDPKQCTIFSAERRCRRTSELNTCWSMITPLSWLERVPTYKDQQEQLKEKDLATYRVSGVSVAAVGGHSGVPAGVCAGGAGPGGARGDYAGDCAAVQPFVWGAADGCRGARALGQGTAGGGADAERGGGDSARAEGAADTRVRSCRAPMGARCRRAMGTRSC